MEPATYHYFEITPMGKPRLTQRDRWARRPVVLRYFAFCDELRRQAKEAHFELAPMITLHFHLPMPPSWSKKKRWEMGGAPHQQRPDSDNLAKSVLDALLEEDCTVWDLHITKTWNETPGIGIQNR